MKSILWSALWVLSFLHIVALGAGAQSQPISFGVWHEHRIGHCEGVLRLNNNGIVYETPHRKHARVWDFSDTRQVEIFSTTRLVIHTYGNPRTFDFRLLEAEVTGDAYRFLADHIGRGLTSRVLFPATEFRFQMRVKHRHRMGGCEGMLRIADTEIVYETEDIEDRRIWRIRDIRSFGTTGPYDLRLSTEAETFVFDLKEAIDQDVYDYLWQRIYGPHFAPKGNSF